MAVLKNEQLWLRYKRQGDLTARDDLITLYVHLVRQVAGRLIMGLSSQVDLDDLIGYGVFGLLDAIEKFDPNRGIKFETYSVTRIRGSILDGLRSMDWVPQSVRQKSRMLEATYLKLEQELGRSASDQEVAEALELKMNEFDRLLTEVGNISLFYLDDIWPGVSSDEDSQRIIDTLNDPNVQEPTAHMEYEDTKALLAEAIDKLPERERLVISLYYFDSLTLKEIGVVLELSESRISQLHTKAIFRLRGRLSRQKKKIFVE
jgi:RNA polymerase sigma factor for flagellar operon FliA